MNKQTEELLEKTKKKQKKNIFLKLLFWINCKSSDC